MLVKGALSTRFTGWALTAAQWPCLRRSHTATEPSEPAPGDSVRREEPGPAVTAPATSVIDEAVRKITLNLGLKTEALVAHGVGVKEALERQHQLHLGMLLAARRKAVREGREGPGYKGLMVSDALRKSVERIT